MPLEPICDDLGFDNRDPVVSAVYAKTIFMSLPALVAEPFEVEQTSVGK